MAQVIVINSINSASGKTLITTLLALLLAEQYSVAVMDSIGGNSPLAMFIAKRHTLNLSKDYNLSVPQYHSLNKESFEKACQECDVVILDSPDSKFFKNADILLTILHGKEGLSAISEKNSLYASLIWDAKKQRAADGKNAFRWLVIPNDDFSPQELEGAVNTGKLLGFLITPHLNNRIEYDQGLKQGITVLDKNQPALKTLFDLPDLYARRNLKKIAEFIWQNK